MDNVYLVCAIAGGTLIGCQFLLTLFGLGGHHDVGGGHDIGGHDMTHDFGADHDASHVDSSWFFGMLTFRTLTAAVAFFGLAGLAASRELEPLPTLLVAVGAGAVALVIVGWLMRLLTTLNLDGTVRIERAVGTRGTVYLAVPGGKSGVGKVHVSLQNRTMEYKAITSQQQLPTGAKIIVVGIISSDTVEVASATD